MASSSVPIFLCGKFPAHTAASIEKVRPEFEIIETGDSQEAIVAKLTPLLAENKVRAIAMGGGFPDEVYNTVRDTVPGAKDVPWFRPQHKNPDFKGPPPSGPPTAEQVSTALKKGLNARVDELREGKGSGENWYF